MHLPREMPITPACPPSSPFSGIYLGVAQACTHLLEGRCPQGLQGPRTQVCQPLSTRNMHTHCNRAAQVFAQALRSIGDADTQMVPGHLQSHQAQNAQMYRGTICVCPWLSHQDTGQTDRQVGGGAAIAACSLHTKMASNSGQAGKITLLAESDGGWPPTQRRRKFMAENWI